MKNKKPDPKYIVAVKTDKFMGFIMADDEHELRHKVKLAGNKGFYQDGRYWRTRDPTTRWDKILQQKKESRERLKIRGDKNDGSRMDIFQDAGLTDG